MQNSCQSHPLHWAGALPTLLEMLRRPDPVSQIGPLIPSMLAAGPTLAIWQMCLPLISCRLPGEQMDVWVMR